MGTRLLGRMTVVTVPGHDRLLGLSRSMTDKTDKTDKTSDTSHFSVLGDPAEHKCEKMLVTDIPYSLSNLKKQMH